MTDRATADYPRCNLRSGAVREVNAVPRSGSKNDNKECPIGERASGDNDNCIRDDPEQVTRVRLNACCPVMQPVMIARATVEARK